MLHMIFNHYHITIYLSELVFERLDNVWIIDRYIYSASKRWSRVCILIFIFSLSHVCISEIRFWVPWSRRAQLFHPVVASGFLFVVTFDKALCSSSMKILFHWNISSIDFFTIYGRESMEELLPYITIYFFHGMPTHDYNKLSNRSS